MVCELCESVITSDEKYKKLKDGSIKTHVYYGCCKSKDRDCKSGYINETDLIKQLQKLTNKLDLKKSPMQEKIKSEIRRFKKFQ